MTPQLVGMYTAVPGATPIKCVMPSATGQIVVRNDSPYDVWVKIGMTPPQNAPSAASLNQYSVQVTPGQRVIQAPQPFDGCIYLGTFNSGGKATSGTSSSRANIYVEAYPLGESAGAGASYSALTGLDATSQQRVIAIPITAQTNTLQLDFNGSNSPNIMRMVRAPTWIADGATAHSVTAYVYSIFAALHGSRWQTLSVSIAEYDLTASAIGQTIALVAIGDLFAGHPPVQLIGNQPFGQVITSLPAFEAIGHSYTFVVQFAVSQGWPNPPSAQFPLNGSAVAVYDVDAAAQVPPPSIGNGAATPSGVIY